MDNAKREMLYQVVATNKVTGKIEPYPLFPMIAKPIAEEWASLMREQIRLGNLKTYSDPQISLCLRPYA